jgi:hypothetical protein
MPRGGARPGAGRPKKGSKRGSASAPARLTPVEYASLVMNDPAVDPKRRDSMARSLLSYFRGKVGADGHPTPAEARNPPDEWSAILAGRG